MDKSAIGWLYKTAHRQYWRVAAWYDFDDLIQDGFLCWAKVQAAYVKTVPGVRRLGIAKDERHIMSLFQTTFLKHIHGLATKKRRQIDVPCEHLETTQADQWAPVEFLLAEAPGFVRTAVRGLARGSNRPSRRRRDGTRETTREKLALLAGYESQLKKYLATT